jgi:drug/metabolite transporter (DMT)-like permease
VTGRSLLLVCTLALLWGSGFPLFKIAVETIPPLTVAALRGLFGGLLLLAILGRETPALWRSGVPARSYVAQAIFNCVLPWTFVAWASRTIDASLATVLNSLSPIFAFLLTWGITRHEAVTRLKFGGVLLGLAGVFTIIGLDALQGLGRHTLAELACVAGSFCYALSAILGRRFDKLSPLVPAVGATLASAAILVPLSILVDEPWTLRPTVKSLLGVAGLIVFSTVAAFIVYFRLIATIGTIATTSQSYLRILVGVGLSVAFLGEKLTPTLAAGIVLVISGVVAMTLPGARTPRAPR